MTISTIAQRAAAYLQSFAAFAAGEGRSLIVDRRSYLATVSTGTLIATMVDPYGSGSTFTTVGAVPATLALAAGGRIVAGAGVQTAGTASTIVIRAANGQRAIEEPLSFIAEAIVTPAPTLTPTPAPTAVSVSGRPAMTGTVGQPYSFAPVAENGSGTKRWTKNIALLAGQTFSATTGAIGGTPTEAGTLNGLVITVTDDSGSASTTATSVTVAAAGADVPISSFSVTPVVDTGPRDSVPFTDTGSRNHLIGAAIDVSRTTADFFFAMRDANNGYMARNTGGDRYDAGSYDNGVYNQFSDWLNQPFSPDYVSGSLLVFQTNRDGTAGFYQGDTLVSKLMDKGRITPATGVAFRKSYGDTPAHVTFGANNPPIAIVDPDFDPFTRTLTITLNYSNADGNAPDYAEVSLNGGAWTKARNMANPTPGDATVVLETVSAAITGLVSARIRWHNNPAYVSAFEFDAVLPFGGVFGVNVNAGAAQALNEQGGWRIQAANGSREQLGSIAGLTGFGVHPSSANGQNNTVQRAVDGGIGVNTRGITHYRFFMEYNVDAVSAGNYEMTFAPGVEIMNDSFAPMHDYAYDQATGRMTFRLQDGDHQLFGIFAKVDTIPAGTLLNPRFRKVGVVGKYNAAQVAVVKTVTDMMRNMDGSGINNTNNNTRTLTALPIRTVANSGAQFVDDVDFAKQLGVTHYMAINSHIDDPSYVKAHADYVAANLPAGWKVYVSNFNEIWNFIFSHFYDMHLGGVRAGYGPLEATVSTAVPIRVLDAGDNDLVGEGVFIKCDANGVVQGDGNLNTHIKTAHDMVPGDLFIRNTGGVPMTRVKNNIPAGTVTTNIRIRDQIDPNYERVQEDAWVNRAAKRYASTLAKRNILIWKKAFADAGRPAPKFLIEGRVGEASYAFDMLDWDNLYEHVGGNTSAPYISGGFSFDYMDWTQTDLWDAQARQLIENGDYTAAIELVIPKAIPRLVEMGAAMRKQQAVQRAYNVAKFGVGGKDRIGQFFYEYGDHFGYVRSNWPDDGKAREFWRQFRKHRLYYTFFTAYLEELARIGAIGNWYQAEVGYSSFCLFNTVADTDTSGGPNTNWRYKALKDMTTRVRAATAQYA